ncbi:MAG: hypothetical protein ACLU3F_07590 [Blautia wexlerae]
MTFVVVIQTGVARIVPRHTWECEASGEDLGVAQVKVVAQPSCATRMFKLYQRTDHRKIF